MNRPIYSRAVEQLLTCPRSLSCRDEYSGKRVWIVKEQERVTHTVLPLARNPSTQRGYDSWQWNERYASDKSLVDAADWVAGSESAAKVLNVWDCVLVSRECSSSAGLEWTILPLARYRRVEETRQGGGEDVGHSIRHEQCPV